MEPNDFYTMFHVDGRDAAGGNTLTAEQRAQGVQLHRHCGVPRTLCWADLSTADPKISASDKDPSGYLHIMNGGEAIGGIPPAAHRDPNTPSHWPPYFTVENLDATSAKARQHARKPSRRREKDVST